MKFMQKICCYIMGELCLVERLMILSQSLTKTVRNYDILYVSWTQIYLENVTHLKIEFVISL